MASIEGVVTPYVAASPSRASLLGPGRAQSFRDFSEAYVDGVQALVEFGEVVPGVTDETSVGSSFGASERPTREILGHSFSVEDTSACMFVSRSRSPAIDYSYAQVLWTLAESDSAAWISYYNPRGRAFANEWGRLCGAPGKRLRGKPVGQFEAALRMLSADQSSRRAVLSFARPSDVAKPERDFPCQLAIQFFARERRLVAMTFMRSQSALMVLPYDVFLACSLQHAMAFELGLEAGSYVHVSGSYHLYEDEMSRAKALLADSLVPVSLLPFEAGRGILPDILAFESELRRAVAGSNKKMLSRLIDKCERPDGYWGEARIIFAHTAAGRLHLTDEERRCESMLRDDVVRALLARPQFSVA